MPHSNKIKKTPASANASRTHATEGTEEKSSVKAPKNTPTLIQGAPVKGKKTNEAPAAPAIDKPKAAFNKEICATTKTKIENGLNPSKLIDETLITDIQATAKELLADEKKLEAEIQKRIPQAKELMTPLQSEEFLKNIRPQDRVQATEILKTLNKPEHQDTMAYMAALMILISETMAASGKLNMHEMQNFSGLQANYAKQAQAALEANRASQGTSDTLGTIGKVIGYVGGTVAILGSALAIAALFISGAFTFGTTTMLAIPLAMGLLGGIVTMGVSIASDAMGQDKFLELFQFTAPVLQPIAEKLGELLTSDFFKQIAESNLDFSENAKDKYNPGKLAIGGLAKLAVMLGESIKSQGSDAWKTVLQIGYTGATVIYNLAVALLSLAISWVPVVGQAATAATWANLFASGAKLLNTVAVPTATTILGGLGTAINVPQGFVNYGIQQNVALNLNFKEKGEEADKNFSQVSTKAENYIQSQNQQLQQLLDILRSIIETTQGALKNTVI